MQGGGGHIVAEKCHTQTHTLVSHAPGSSWYVAVLIDYSFSAHKDFIVYVLKKNVV